ncbi:hypothetical protein L0U85_11155 [Glycomyces sp. L485]|uniref:hypothetical protein n=1 Tax=Glycomyces sp. L485 TaxID=2909235 RepID=UPI001F4A0E5C|nr:hypothetical protein [Glycomyces sp. L485]MCH7231401.1 hypothetical protein [Glycomyces sp. L485]
MKKSMSLLWAAVAVVAFSGCQSEQPDDSPSTESAAAEEATTGPVFDPSTLITPVFDPPSDAVENADMPFPTPLEYEHIGWSYDINLPDVNVENRIFVTSYLLPEGSEYPDYNARLELVREYDALVGNAADEGSHNPALVGGNDGIWRFVIIEDGDDRTYQQNYFVTAENHLVQITCQWTNRRDFIRDRCAELQETFSLQ